VYAAAVFESAEAFMDSDGVRETCLTTDLQLPIINGVELKEHLQCRGYRIPVIFITAFPETRVGARALTGAVAFLAKPFE
jgi:FixJ family two-component response regulator